MRQEAKVRKPPSRRLCRRRCAQGLTEAQHVGAAHVCSTYYQCMLREVLGSQPVSSRCFDLPAGALRMSSDTAPLHGVCLRVLSALCVMRRLLCSKTSAKASVSALSAQNQETAMSDGHHGVPRHIVTITTKLLHRCACVMAVPSDY